MPTDLHDFAESNRAEVCRNGGDLVVLKRNNLSHAITGALVYRRLDRP